MFTEITLINICR